MNPFDRLAKIADLFGCNCYAISRATLTQPFPHSPLPGARPPPPINQPFWNVEMNLNENHDLKYRYNAWAFDLDDALDNLTADALKRVANYHSDARDMFNRVENRSVVVDKLGEDAGRLWDENVCAGVLKT